MKLTSKILRLFIPLIIPCVALGLWFALYKWKGEQTVWAVGPHQALAALKNDWQTVWPEALRSLVRLTTGVLLGMSLGVCSGIGLARSPLARLMSAPTLQVMSAIPFLVWIPFLLMAFGFGESFRLSVVTLCTFLLVHGLCFHAISQLSPDFTDLSKIYEKTHSQILLQVLIPAAMPSILNAVRASFVLGWIAVAISERAVAKIPGGGLGYYILRAKENGWPEIMFGGVIVLAALAYIIDRVVAGLQKRLGRWCYSLENVTRVESTP